MKRLFKHLACCGLLVLVGLLTTMPGRTEAKDLGDDWRSTDKYTKRYLQNYDIYSGIIGPTAGQASTIVLRMMTPPLLLVFSSCRPVHATNVMNFYNGNKVTTYSDAYLLGIEAYYHDLDGNTYRLYVPKGREAAYVSRKDWNGGERYFQSLDHGELVGLLHAAVLSEADW